MKIAVPCANNQLCAHFGHCEAFAVMDVDQQTKEIAKKEMLTPPPHEPGVLPVWLHELGVEVVIAGGMGQRAQNLFTQNGIRVVTGALGGTPEDLASAYVDGSLATGGNLCDH